MTLGRPLIGSILTIFIPTLLLLVIRFNPYMSDEARVAGVGWLSVIAAKSLRAFVERVFAKFLKKT